jgi:2-methylcitrate dehydratase PrpD
MSKYAMYGPISQTGAMATLLAERGFTGEPKILDGPKGLWRTLGSVDCDWRWLVEGRRGGGWFVEDACYKPYPACRFNGPAIDLFLALLADNQLDPASIESIEVLVPAAGLSKHKANVAQVDNLVDATFSLPHLLGAAAFAGAPGPAWLREAARSDQRIRDLAAKVTMAPLPEAGALAAEDVAAHGHIRRMPTRVRITAAGESYEARADYARGDVFDPAFAFEYADIADKFRSFSQGILDPDQIERAIDLVSRLEDLASIHELVDNLVAQKAGSGATAGELAESVH